MSFEQDRDDCELAIKKTLAYRSIFKYPVSEFQLKTFLITGKEFKNKTFLEALDHLCRRGFVKEKNKKYFLPGLASVDWHERKALTKKIIGKNTQVLKLLGKIPWLKLVAITGSVAAYNTQNSSDVDVLIISAKNRLWLTRFFVVVLLRIAKKYPKTDGEKGKICTNLFIDEKELAWDVNKRNIFVAHDIVSMQPIINKENSYFRFLLANKWVANYFAHVNFGNSHEKLPKNFFSSPLLDLVEKLVMKIQMNHMRKKQTTETTTAHLIHFNKNDNSQRILSAYNKVLENRKIS